MCRWMAYLGAPRHVDDWLFSTPRALANQARHSYKAVLCSHGDGVGFGWYGSRAEPGVYRSAGPAWGDGNLRELARQIDTGLAFAHVRASTGAPNVFVNCHPFRAGRWLFMHNGQIGGFCHLRRQLERELSDACYCALEGGTDSELIFRLMVCSGLEREPEHAMRTVMSRIEAVRGAAGVDEPFRATFALSDGRSLWAVRWSSDPHPPSLFHISVPGGRLLVSEPLDDELHRWTPVADNTLIRLDRVQGGDISLHQEPFLTLETSACC